MPGEPENVTIRRACVDDAAALRRTHVAAWQAAYRGVMSDEFLDAMDPEQSESWRDVIAALPPDRVVAVADPGDGTIAGFATVGAEREGEPVGELVAINCHPDWFGHDVGRQLLAGAEADLVRLGHRPGVLWVVDSNVRARRFYERNGWAPDGQARTVEIGGASVAEVRYAKDLTTPT